MADLTEGVVVRLNSGGPKMTILKTYSPTGGPLSGTQMAECQWFLGDDKLMKDHFPIKSLKTATDDDEFPIEPQF